MITSRVDSEQMPSRSIGLSLSLLLITVLLGSTVRFAPLGLPPFVVKSGGSALWALMIYWIVSTLLPSWPPFSAALLATAIAAAVEFAKLYHSPSLDAFRLTLPGMILLSRFFSVWDIAAYTLAITLVALIETRLRPRLRSRDAAPTN